jgi:acetyl-CoA carboxylase biotin carboxyl carrier protein
MFDLSKLKEIVALMGANDLAEVSVRQGDDHITIKRGAQSGTQVNHQPVIYQGTGGHTVHPASPAYHPPTGAPQPVALAPEVKPASRAEAPAEAKAGAFIESPMVGTFYSKPTPDAKPFVTPGQKVTPDTVVCIIEAMKVFNEIKAEKAGTIEGVMVKDGQAVEFGQKLFGVK